MKELNVAMIGYGFMDKANQVGRFCEIPLWQSVKREKSEGRTVKSLR